MAADQVNALLDALRNRATQLKGQDRVSGEDIDDLKELLAQVERAVSGGDASQLDAFFRSVGASLVSAQQDLDRRSRDYQAKGAPLPTQFRIPRAEARFQFAISKVSDQGIGLIVYNSRTRQEQSQHHEISFEIASAPVTPDQLGLPPGLQQAGMAVRELLRQRLAALAATADDEPQSRARELLAHFDETLCVGAADRWFVARVFDAGNRLDLTLFEVPVTPGRTANLGEPALIRNTTQQRQDLLVLLQGLATQQAAWLAARRGAGV